MAKKTGTVKKKVVKVGAQGMAFVHSTFKDESLLFKNVFTALYLLPIIIAYYFPKFH